MLLQYTACTAGTNITVKYIDRDRHNADTDSQLDTVCPIGVICKNYNCMTMAKNGSDKMELSSNFDYEAKIYSGLIGVREVNPTSHINQQCKFPL